MPSYTDFTNQRRIAAELLAYVVWKQFPNVLLAGGGVTKLGFFYDFIFEQNPPSDFLSFIEMHLKTLIKEDLPIRFAGMMRENAESFFEHHHQPVLAHLARAQELNVIDLMQMGAFSGVCPVLPIESTSQVGHVKLFDVQHKEIELDQEICTVIRLVGTAFPYFTELKQFSKQYDQYLKKKDHRLLGKELNLFSQNSHLGDMEWIWHPKGQCLRNLLQNWAQSQEIFSNYQYVATPLVIKNSKRKKPDPSIFTLSVEEEAYELSPSRLVQHLVLLQSLIQSQDVLPMRLVEYGMVYRSQPKSELFGLLCADSALADQRTIICPKKLLIKELISSLLFIEQIIRIFGFEACWYLVTSPRKSAKDRVEKEAVEWLEQAVQQSSLFYPFQSEKIEEEQLVGPRLELRIVDELQREWSTATLAIVVHERKALDLLKGRYQNEDDSKTPVVLSQSLWGSVDRFLALLIERSEGVLPAWLAPEQVRFLAISEKVHSFVKEAAERCQQRGIRVKLDLRDVKLSQKVHDVRKEKVPYVVIVGEQELKKKHLTVQNIKRPDKSQVLELDAFISLVLKEASSPVLKPAINL